MSTKRRLWPKVAAGFVLLVVVGFVFRKPLLTKFFFWWIVPSKPFAAYQPPLAPDYAQPGSWAALPTFKGYAQFVPTGVKQPKGPKQADVFYIHPTTYLSSKSWNAPLDDKKAKRRIDVAVTKHQASVFNACCRVFAPRYRQATLAFALKFKDSGRKALEFAYADVVRAFKHYIKHWNKGRPFILAGHSQGAIHGLRLLEEHISSWALRRQLVAAYLVGNPVHQDKFQQMLKRTPPCKKPDDTSCVMSWMTLGKDAESVARYSRLPKYYPPKGYQDVSKRKHICTNPLSWKAGGILAEAKLHLGAIPYTKKKKPIPKPYVGIVSAQCKPDGALMISKPTAKGFDRHIFGKDDYHIYDYHLFYMNIRQNAMTRVKAFLAKKSQPK